MTDRHPIDRHQREGTPEVLGALVRQHIHMVHAAARQYVGDPSLADDVTQAVFLLLIRRAAHLPPQATIAGWLYKTTWHVASEIRRQNQRRARREREAHAMSAADRTPPPSTDPAGRTLAGEERAALYDAIARLSDDDRSAVVLSYLEGHSSAEVAATLGTSDAAVRTRLTRARERLREFLGRTGITLSAAALAITLESSKASAAPVATLAHVQTLIEGAAPAAHITALVTGVLKMTLRTKLIAALAALAVIALAFPLGYYFMRPHNNQPAVAVPLAAESGPATLEGLPILQVDIAGNTQTESGIILREVHEQVGQTYSKVALDQDVVAVAALGRFTTVRAEAIAVEDPQAAAPRPLRGVNIRWIVEEKPIVAGAFSTPRSAVLAAYHDALGGDETAFITHFGSLSDDGKAMPLTADQDQLLRAVVHGMHAFDLLTAALGEKFGADFQAQFARQSPTYVNPADMENATARLVDSTHAIVETGNSGPRHVPVVCINGAWLVDVNIVSTVNTAMVQKVDTQIDRLNALTAAVKAGQFPDAASFSKATSGMFK